MLPIESVFVCLAVAAFAASVPVKDVEIVESTIREVRAAAPEDLLLAETSYGHDYASDDEDSVGYLKREEDGGSDGYKHFDSYHKKDGDKYAYEKHTSFGDADHASYDSDSKDDGNADKNSYKEAEGSEEAESEYGPSAKYYSEGGDAGEAFNYGYFGGGESEKYTAAEDGEAETDGSEEY